MFRDVTNYCSIEGILSEIDLKYGSFNKDNQIIETINGEVKILVEQEINGKIETLEVPVTMFAQKYKKDGTIGPGYKALETIKNNYVSIAAAGTKEGADKVSINGAQIRISEFVGRDNKLVSIPTISTCFMSRVTNNFNPHAKFQIEFVVSNISYVTDSQGIEVEPKKLKVTAVVPQYNDYVDVIDFYATNPNVIHVIKQNWEVGKTYKANGNVNFTSRTEKIVDSSGFGEPVIKERTVKSKEFIITGGSQMALTGSLELNIDEIKRCLALRKERMEAKIAKGKTSAHAPAPVNSTQASITAEDMGF